METSSSSSLESPWSSRQRVEPTSVAETLAAALAEASAEELAEALAEALAESRAEPLADTSLERAPTIY